MKKNIYLLSLLFFFSINSYSSAESFEENYACGVDMYMLSSIFRFSTEKGDNLELKNAAIREHTHGKKSIFHYYLKENQILLNVKRDLNQT